MNIQTFDTVIKDQLALCADMLTRKGHEYAGEAERDTTVDRLEHFKKAAVLTDSTAKQALLGMLAKHLVSIADMCKKGRYPTGVWTEKITDSINYLLILRALVEEDQINETD